MVLLSTESLFPQGGRQRKEEGRRKGGKKVSSRTEGREEEKERSHVKPLGWVLTYLSTLTNLIIIIICILEMR